jgi:hypothetical protein
MPLIDLDMIKIDLDKYGLSDAEKRAVERVFVELKGVTKMSKRGSKGDLKQSVRLFLMGDSDSCRLAIGTLKVDERTTRIEFAQRHCARSVKDWMKERDVSLEQFVDANSHESRVGLVELLGGEWIDNDAIVDWVG